jgi:hypothetical protein
MNIFLKTLTVLMLSLISGIFYHLSGLGKDGKIKYPNLPLWLFDRQWRRTGCTVLNSVAVLLWYKPHSLYENLLFLLFMGLTYGAITTYWDWLFNNKDNFYMHGFMIGLTSFPLVFIGIHWYSVLINSIVSSVLMGWLCSRTGKVWIEENGRGFIIIITRTLLLI